MRRTVLFTAALLTAWALTPLPAAPARDEDKKPDVIFVPTPQEVVD